jgi:hypothetical protein
MRQAVAASGASADPPRIRHAPQVLRLQQPQPPLRPDADQVSGSVAAADYHAATEASLQPAVARDVHCQLDFIANE